MNPPVPPTVPPRARRTFVSRAAAFTLVELLVVIGIIALLISILLPSLNQARQSANSVTCQSSMRQFGVALALYTNAYNSSFPFGTFDGTFDDNTSSPRDPSKGFDWTVMLASMLGEGGPTWEEQQASLTGARGIFRDMDTVGAIVAPSGSITAAAGGEPDFCHYTVHPRLMPEMEYRSPPKYATYMKPYKITQIRNSSELAAIWDGVQIAEAGYNAATTSYCIDNCSMFSGHCLLIPLAEEQNVPFDKVVDIGDNTDVAIYAVQSAMPRFRHKSNTSGNFLFLDGHVAAIKYIRPKESELLLRNLLVPKID